MYYTTQSKTIENSRNKQAILYGLTSTINLYNTRDEWDSE